MIFFPAIDLKDAKVVRLHQGDYGRVTPYPEDPIRLAARWAEQGVQWIHMVDLDAAKSGYPVHQALIAQVAKTPGLKVQVGGGIRSLDMARSYLDQGISRVVVGTRAVQDPDFLRSLGEQFPGQVALGLDTKDGKVAVQGWTQSTPLSAQALLNKLSLEGIACVIFTDIARDGTLQGPNLEALETMLAESPVPVIASGGISSLADLKSLRDLKNKNLLGVIAGKALYEGKITVPDALQALKS
jgi:phosphoribosylformimino-5-aminoimidazole carboxamide ribotide isomerase